MSMWYREHLSLFTASAVGVNTVSVSASRYSAIISGRGMHFNDLTRRLHDATACRTGYIFQFHGRHVCT